MQVTERLRNGIAREPFKTSSPHGPLTVTVSCGAVMIDGEKVQVEEALRRADDELYRAKEGGRNRTYFAGHGIVTPQEGAPNTPAAQAAAPAAAADAAPAAPAADPAVPPAATGTDTPK
jgi:hypothetical protein